MDTTKGNAGKRPPEAWRTKELFEKGLGYVVISRFKSEGRVESGVFLLDIWCQGVKDAFFVQLHDYEYQERLMERIFRSEAPEAMSPACARKLVQDAVAYAEKLGLAPHPDFRKAARVWGGISAEECAETFTFGKDGKPFFVQGPNDHVERIEFVMQQLTMHCGEGNFHFLLSAGQSITEPEPGEDPAS